MKRFLFPILAVALLAGAMSCQREHLGTAPGDKVNVTFQLGLEGLQTKAFSDGTSATTLDVLVYNVREESTVYLDELSLQEADAFDDLAATVSLVLARGERYQIIFWAHAPNAPYTIDAEKATLTVNTDSATANDELRDGFLGKYDAVITEPVSLNVQLKRPFAQINVLTTIEDWENAQANGLEFSGSSMTVTAPTELNLISGEVSKEEEQVFAMAAIDPAVNIPEFAEEYMYVAMNYVLADLTTTLVGESDHPFTFEVYREGQDNYVYQHSMVNVPIQRNYRTVIVGQVFCVDASFEVEIVPDYEGNLNGSDNTATIATITASNVTVEEGKTVEIGATTNSSAAITYASSDESIATVSTDGVVTGVKAGTATITLSVAAVEGEFTSATKNITVTVTAAAVNPPVSEGIKLDGGFTDWANITAVAGATDRILETKYASDASNLYIMYKIDASKIKFGDGSYNWASYIYVGFDTDNKATTGDNAGGGVNGGYEAMACIFPWRGETEGSPSVVNGTDDNGWIKCPANLAEGAAGVTVFGKFESGFCYLEVGIPLNMIGSPTGQITVNSAMDWYVDGDHSVTLGSSTTDPGDEPGGDEPGGDNPGGGDTDGIKIDGDMADWGDIAALTSTGTSRFRSWKFSSDDNSLYFYFVLRKNRMSTANTLSLVFDWDDSGSLSSEYLTDGELVVKLQPFTNATEGTPVCVNGTINNAIINGTEVTNASIKAYGADPDSTDMSDTADYYLEMSIPRSVLPNLPVKGTTIKIGATYNWYNTGFQEVTI